MAENKQSFVLYTDLLKVVEKLVLQDRENKTNYSGELFYHILQYVNDQNPIPINFIIELAFEPIKCQLKRDLKKYKIIKERRSLAGKQGGRPKKETENSDEEKAKEAIALFDKQSKAKKAVNDTVTVNDTVNDAVNDAVKKGLIEALKDSIKDVLIVAVKSIIVKEKGASINDVMDKTGKSNATVKRYLQILKIIDLVEFKGTPKTGKYFITPVALIKMKRKI